MNARDYGYGPEDAPPPKPMHCEKCGRFVSAAHIDVLTKGYPRFRILYNDAGEEIGEEFEGEDTADFFVVHCRACDHITELEEKR